MNIETKETISRSYVIEMTEEEARGVLKELNHLLVLSNDKRNTAELLRKLQQSTWQHGEIPPRSFDLPNPRSDSPVANPESDSPVADSGSDSGSKEIGSETWPKWERYQAGGVV